MSKPIEVYLDQLDENIKFSYNSSEVRNGYEYLYLKALVPRNISCDDPIRVTLNNNVHNPTSNYTVIYPDTQYINNQKQTTDEANLSFTIDLTNLHQNLQITDIRDIKYTTYHMSQRVFYLAIKRETSDNNDATDLKNISFTGNVLFTNIDVGMVFSCRCFYIPVTPPNSAS